MWLSHWIPRGVLFGVVVTEESSRTDDREVEQMGDSVEGEIWVAHQKDLSGHHADTTHLAELTKARTLGHVLGSLGPMSGGPLPPWTPFNWST